ncbi:MAG: hypothetical protein DRI48_10040 [Chloroflexi bacterium]|nr:MAG: hypothetical protein DRI48_10040 [Chloroflexota bacterium]
MAECWFGGAEPELFDEEELYILAGLEHEYVEGRVCPECGAELYLHIGVACVEVRCRECRWLLRL